MAWLGGVVRALPGGQVVYALPDVGDQVPNDPMVSFVVTLTVSEDGEALAGQGEVYVGGERMQRLRLDRDHLEVPFAIAAGHAVDACRDWLKIHAATRPDDTPPTPQKPARRRQGKTTTSRGVSRSRLR